MTDVGLMPFDSDEDLEELWERIYEYSVKMGGDPDYYRKLGPKCPVQPVIHGLRRISDADERNY